MHGRGRRQGDLWRHRRDVAQELEFIERERLRAADLSRGIRRGEFHLVSAVVAKLERRRPDFKAVGALDKAAPIGSAAEFAVGHDLQAERFLQPDDAANAIVQNVVRNPSAEILAGGVVAMGLPQRGRAQQAADMVGAKRRVGSPGVAIA